MMQVISFGQTTWRLRRWFGEGRLGYVGITVDLMALHGKMDVAVIGTGDGDFVQW
ncbi:MAG: hypothetical protein R3C68_06045 [Myxococcota bacterium]